ncbi:MAG: hypothetical protein A3K16_05795 [Omnitrophica bacterium RIFCSPLOWO2_01_FULL_45_24]|nr:MAG: hypothetical protein A3K16_05795 [Omnitrophica bacterium RIFCSPLOWO2_01_FULL_45_24]
MRKVYHQCCVKSIEIYLPFLFLTFFMPNKFCNSIIVWPYLTLYDSDLLEQAKEDPNGLFREDKPTIIDKVI